MTLGFEQTFRRRLWRATLPSGWRRRILQVDVSSCAYIRYLPTLTNMLSDNAFFEYIKSLSPAKIDLEIRSLLSLEHLELFIRALIARLKTHKDFEVVQALLNVCLTIHSDLLMENAELRAALEELLAEQKKESGRLMNLISYSLGTISFLRSGA